MNQGEAFGPYRVTGSFGRGGMGVVYRARHEAGGSEVAIKTVLAPRAELLESIRREIHALSLLRHPGVARIVGSGISRGIPWYAMEVVEGASLRVVFEESSGDAPSAQRRGASTAAATSPFASPETFPLPARGLAAGAPAGAGDPAEVAGSRARMPLRAALTLARRLCVPLAYLHGEGIVHRDLKPDNVIVRPDGVPVIVDFGLTVRAGGAESRETLEQAGMAVGTVAYMSPEQVLGAPVDARTDLYALGCVLFELVTGRPPFLGDVPSVLRMHVDAPPIPASELAEGIPRELDELLLSLLAKRPSERLAHADAVEQALRTLGAEAFPVEAPLPRPYLYRARLVGRAELLGSLHAWLRARDQQRVALLLGEAGIGKTRLLTELTGLATDRGLQVLTGDVAVPGTPARPLGPLLKVLRAAADRAREGGAASARRLLGGRSRLLARFEPSLAGIPGLEDDPEPAELDPGAARLRLLSYLHELLAALADHGALLLVIDDLQWADELTRAFLEELARSPLERVWAIAGARSEELSDALAALTRQREVASFRVERLADGDVPAMVGDMLGASPPPFELAEHLRDCAEGNPFFVAEYLNAGVADGFLGRDARGRWRLSGEGALASMAGAGVPARLQALVARRVASVGATARRFLAAAAVLGRAVDLSLVGRLSGLVADDVMKGAVELLARQILEEEEGRLRFSHERLREQVLASMDGAERAARHREAAACLEDGAALARALQLAAIARHWELGGERPLAKLRYVEAARADAARWASASAAGLYGAALALSEGPEPELRLAQGKALLWAEGWASVPAAEAFREAWREAAEAGDHASIREARRSLGYATWRRGELDEARELLTPTPGEQGDDAEGLALRASLEHDARRLPEAEELYRRALAILAERGDERVAARVKADVASLFLDRGRREEARALYAESLAAARRHGERHIELIVLGNLALLEPGGSDEALGLLGRSVEVARDIGARAFEGMMLQNLADQLRHRGRPDEARARYEEALPLLLFAGDRLYAASAGLGLATLAISRGELAVAGLLAAEALGRAEGAGDASIEAAALVQLARVARLGGELDLAAARLSGAGAILDGHPDAAGRLWLEAERARLVLARGGLPALHGLADVPELADLPADLGAEIDDLRRAVAAASSGHEVPSAAPTFT